MIELPAGADVGVFLASNGKLTQKPALEKPITFGELVARYLIARPSTPKEANTCYTEDIHLAHLQRILTPDLPVLVISAETLQGYLDKRAKESGRHGRPLSHTTLKKEIATFASVWNRWALPQGLVAIPAPTKGLLYRKSKAKPPFQTWDQISRQVARGGMSQADEQDLWDTLFLDPDQIVELLSFVKASCPEHIAVMFAFAAYTGTRRSEMLRARVDDFDFEANTIVIREKKRDRSREFTFRVVPLAPQLREALQSWFGRHPGGQVAICERPNVELTTNIAAKAFRAAVDGSKWEVLLGWHILRHSFASICAMRGVDQRFVDRWLGHQTEEMRLRYQHLFPDQQQAAMRSVFTKPS